MLIDAVNQALNALKHEETERVEWEGKEHEHLLKTIEAYKLDVQRQYLEPMGIESYEWLMPYPLENGYIQVGFECLGVDVTLQGVCIRRPCPDYPPKLSLLGFGQPFAEYIPGMPVPMSLFIAGRPPKAILLDSVVQAESEIAKYVAQAKFDQEKVLTFNKDN